MKRKNTTMSSNNFKNTFVWLSSEQYNFQIINYGFDNCEPNRPPSIYSSNANTSLHFIIEGSGYLAYDGYPTIKVQKGQIFALLPSSPAKYWPDEKKPYKYFWISFLGNGIIPVLEKLNISAKSPIISPINKSTIKRLFIENFNHSQKYPQFADIINKSYLYKIFFTLLLEEHIEQKKETGLQFASHIELAQKYISLHYADHELNLQEVATYCHLNKAYFSRIFVKAMGITFTNYLLDFRIRQAISFFQQGETSIQDVAYRVGFISPYYFSNVFKKITSVSPKKYIQLLKQE